MTESYLVLPQDSSCRRPRNVLQHVSLRCAYGDWPPGRRASDQIVLEAVANAERRDKVVRLHPGPLRGRSEPVAVALGALRSAVHHGSSTLIMIGGAPGIGKTAMLGEVCRQAARMGLRVASGRCEPIRQVSPGAPVIAALRMGRSLLADAGEYAQLVELAGQPLLLAERIATVIECAAAARPVLVSVASSPGY